VWSVHHIRWHIINTNMCAYTRPLRDFNSGIAGSYPVGFFPNTDLAWTVHYETQMAVVSILSPWYGTLRGNVLLDLVLNWAPRYGDVLGSGGIAPPILTSALDGDKWPASCPGRFISSERLLGTHWIGGCVDTRAGLNAVAKRTFPILAGILILVV
jgi:hypothetical protein